MYRLLLLLALLLIGGAVVLSSAPNASASFKCGLVNGKLVCEPTTLARDLDETGLGARCDLEH